MQNIRTSYKKKSLFCSISYKNFHLSLHKGKSKVVAFICLILLTILLSIFVLPGVTKVNAVNAFNQSDSAIIFLLKGKSDYQTGNFFQALEELQRATKEFEALGDLAKQAESLHYLAWGDEEMGNSTYLMTESYKNLIEGGQNKAEALRQSQLFLLEQDKYQHPYDRDTFILLGNWL